MFCLLQINVTAKWGSTGHIAEDIGQFVISHGWESHIAYGRYVNDSKSQLFHIGAKNSIYGHLLLTRLFDRHGLASKQATRQLITYIEKIKPDIIHLHNIHGYYLNYPILFDYLSRTDIPVIWTLHDCWTFTGHCAYYDYIKCERWKAECHDCPQKKKYPTSLLFDRSRKNFRDKKRWFTSLRNLTLVPVSKWLENEVKQSFLKDFPIETIRNGIDLEIFKPCSIQKDVLGLDDKFIILGVASVWSSRKGLEDFVLLRESLPDDYVIILVGLNDKQIKQLPAGIIGIPRTNTVQELIDYYSLANVYVNTSVEETLGMTTIESLACGTPAIVYDATACPETVSSDCGFVVRPHNITELVMAIRHICSSNNQFSSAICRKWVETHFDKQISNEKYLSLYQRLINKKP